MSSLHALEGRQVETILAGHGQSPWGSNVWLLGRLSRDSQPRRKKQRQIGQGVLYYNPEKAVVIDCLHLHLQRRFSLAVVLTSKCSCPDS